ncbi:DivIVA domain-containing protein [Microbacterium sp.]|uniref:DivIVA domain-containing protein n=1 Tax=Microbacterium sp. TaxID=51671 RepID=UPI003A8D2F0A
MTTHSSADRRQASGMFPTVTGRHKGYAPKAVDDFLHSARSVFEGGGSTITASDVRSAAFPLVRRGYQPDAVDAALARIEDAFAARERNRAVTAGGTGVWIDGTRRRAQEILDRLSRPPRKRFGRVRGLGYGYRIDEVDIVADRLAEFLSDGRPVTVEQVRTVAFRMQRRGYREAQVDALLDAVVDVMLAVA